MSNLILTSVFLPFAAAFLVLIIGKKRPVLQNATVILSSLVVLALVVLSAIFAKGSAVSILSMNFSADGFQLIYAVVTAFMWFAASLICPQYFKGHKTTRFYFFFLITFGGTLGVFLSRDLITTFIFFEIMSFASYVWVVEEETVDAMAAGKTYLTIAVLGGMSCLMGLFMLYNITGTLVISELYDAVTAAGSSPALYTAAFCMLFGFGSKAGLFPLHIWLPKAHPVAPAPASALLSGVLTKTGVFGILVITANIMRHNEIWGYTLLVLAVITMVLGAVLALVSTNLKRTLACSSLSQIGFITVGVSMICLLGEENALAANGTVLYMINHSIVKLVLFLSAGAIYKGSHTLDINKLKGYGRNKPAIMVPFLIGACSLAGIPGFCGYISKTLVHESIVEYASHAGALITAVEWLFLLSGGLTLAYMLKLFVTIFVAKPTEDTPKTQEKMPLLSGISLWISALPLLVLGLMPHSVSEKIAALMTDFVNGYEMHHRIEYLSFTNLKGALISICIGVTVFALVIPLLLMKNQNGKKVHFNPFEKAFTLEENLYVPLIKGIVFIFNAVCRFCSDICEPLFNGIIFLLTALCRIICDITDFIVYLLHKTVFRAAKEPSEPHTRKYAFALGNVYGRILKKEGQGERFASASETIEQTTRKISKGFTFALVMTCFGICVILIFLLFIK